MAGGWGWEVVADEDVDVAAGGGQVEWGGRRCGLVWRGGGSRVGVAVEQECEVDLQDMCDVVDDGVLVEGALAAFDLLDPALAPAEQVGQ
jgi:hypothetical protein